MLKVYDVQFLKLNIRNDSKNTHAKILASPSFICLIFTLKVLA